MPPGHPLCTYIKVCGEHFCKNHPLEEEQAQGAPFLECRPPGLDGDSEFIRSVQSQNPWCSLLLQCCSFLLILHFKWWGTSSSMNLQTLPSGGPPLSPSMWQQEEWTLSLPSDFNYFLCQLNLDELRKGLIEEMVSTSKQDAVCSKDGDITEELSTRGLREAGLG